MSIRTAILVDEINAMHQIHSLNIEGINPWVSFFETIKNLLEAEYGEIDCHYHFYGAIHPKEIDKQRFYDRKRFFEALQKDGIQVHKGICQQDFTTGRLQEKCVDVLLALDIVEFAREKYDLLFIFSGDTDLIPAVKRAKKHSKVIAIIKDGWPAKYMRQYVDSVVSLEMVINLIDKTNIMKKTVRNIT